MKAESAPLSVADYCSQLIAGKITVNRDYQRDDRIWSPYIRSYFIESILLEYPIPKLFLYVRFNLTTKLSSKEIVDGQQRSQALRLFYENRMQISSRVDTEEIRGKKYRDLSPDMQGKFLAYSLPIDEFRGVSEDEIRESFARMNVHNVSLNAEELRNAKFQGAFKVFILRLAKAYREKLLSAGVISRRDVVRMADTRLFSDITLILHEGFRTTKPEDVDSLYDLFEVDFPKEAEWFALIREACNEWQSAGFDVYEELGSKHVYYTLIAALIEKMSPGVITALLSPEQRAVVDATLAKPMTLQQLNEDIQRFRAAKASEENPALEFPNFVAACTVKTNVADEKLVRFAHLLRAVT